MSEVSQTSELQIYKIASTLDEAELAATYQRFAGASPGELNRAQIVAYLAENPPANDFEATVGEIKAQVAATKTAEEQNLQNALKTPEELDKSHDTDDEVRSLSVRNVSGRSATKETAPVSWSPGVWTPAMSQGPAKKEAHNRLKWALELAKEQEAQRLRLGEFAGVRLVEWTEGRIEDPPDPDTDECHLDLVYQTQCDDESIASVAKKLGLEERFLLRLNN